MRFDQVKVFARDVRSLADFYRDALECELLEPVRDFDDEALGRAFGAPGRRIRLGFLGLPGREGGPILELYEFPDRDAADWPYRPGQSHLAFGVEDVEEVARRVEEKGGSYLGEITTWTAPSGNLATFVFMRDPEGNLVDLWARAKPGDRIS